MSNLQLIPLSKVKADTATQSRVSISAELVDDYAEKFKAGDKFPPVDSVFDGQNYWVWDGIHRTQGAAAAGLETIEATVTPGTLDDAKWLACSANKTHGLRRTNADKERAVKQALASDKSKGMSDHAIAEWCGVSQPMVSNYRKQNAAPTENGFQLNQETPKKTGVDGKARDTSKVSEANKKRAKPKADPPKVSGGTTFNPGELDAAPANPPAPMKDKLNAIVPELLRQVFVDASLFNGIESAFKQIKEAISAISHSAAGAHLDAHTSNSEKYHAKGLDSVHYGLIYDAKPYCVCVNCDGSGKVRIDACKSCKGCGWLTKHKYTQIKNNAEGEADIRRRKGQ